MDSKKISMAEIAEMSGVSTATVSRILNHNGRYSEETEQKVMEIVQKYGYKVNQSAKSLRTNRTQSIGVIVPDITNEFFARIIRAIETYIVPKGYTVFVCDSNEDSEMEDFHISSLITKDVDGIIYISAKSNVENIFEKYNIPVVYIDRRPENAGTLIISDNEIGGYLATNELLEKGCTNVVMLTDKNNYSTVKHRYSGFCKALKKHNKNPEDSLVLRISVSYDSAKCAILKLIEKKVKFDGIFANNDIMALGALHALRSANIKVPEEIKIIGFDNISLSKICSPPLTTVSQDTDKFGKRSVDALLNLIKGEKANDGAYIIPVELIKREST